MKKEPVKVWTEIINLPTYRVGEPEKNPMFLEKRVYQGSSGVVYPHAVIEKIYDEKSDKQYQAVFLENEYLKIMILPELGGRVQMAFDKVKNRHFIYYNQVIKPALVGLTGPWISGGIEFNWPQHHRPSTFEPVDFTIKENEDGSKTVWVNEVERMFRTKGMAGFTLYPGKAYLEISGRLYNRTPFPQTFLWWANPAVKVNDHYQSVFPPDVNAVFDHGKRDVSSFPIATGTYYKINYAPGTDISRYKNIPVPTSYMAVASSYNFIGGYEHDTRGGLIHVADHHISPGKKQWTWGNGEFGYAWDRHLTDEDGPYIELMTGVYTDNQPDFSWLQPYEEKSFEQYFMPYSEVGLVKNATREAVVNLEFEGATADVKLYVTSKYEVTITLLVEDEIIFKEIKELSPATPYLNKVKLPATVNPEQVSVRIIDNAGGNVLVEYKQQKATTAAVPDPANAALLPGQIETTEQLYLTGLHLEQYRHATYVALDYYEEALRRDDTDARNNNAAGLWYLRRGQFAKAEPYFRKAIATLTMRNPNPKDGEAYYNLGLCLKLLGRKEEAFDAFYKSAWNDAWQHAAYLELARIATAKNDLSEAEYLVGKSLIRNYHSHSARHIKTFVLRKAGKTEAAYKNIEESLALDPFNFGCLYEKYLLLTAENKIEAAQEVCGQLKILSRNWVHNFIEYSFDYAHAGLFDEAAALLQLYMQEAVQAYTMVYYYLGWYALQQDDIENATKWFEQGAAANPDFCFPNRIEDVPVLQSATRINPGDSKAFYYLGNFWYDKRQYEDAIQCWEKSVAINNDFPTVYRNLSLAYHNKLNDPKKALSALEKAFHLDQSDARVLMELDQLYKKLNTSHTTRLQFLEKHMPLVLSRDDLYLERITLYNHLRHYQKAKELIAVYNFHPWEGGEGKVVTQYLICHIELAKQCLFDNDPGQALQLLEAAEKYPVNLGEGKIASAQENDIFYLKGLAYEQLNENKLAETYFGKATQGVSEPAQAVFYNDAQPDKILYQGLAWAKLGEKEKADSIFKKLIDFGQLHLDDKIRIDYFAVSLPDLLVFDADLDLRNKIHCLYMMGLGYLGLGNGGAEKASELLTKVLSMDKNHQGAAIHLQLMKYLQAVEM